VNLEKYRILFVEEAGEHLAEMGRTLASLAASDSEAQAQQSIDVLFRAAHSIKGMAASLDYQGVSALAHRFEDWLAVLRGSGAISAEGVVLAQETLRELEAMLEAVGESGEAGPSSGGRGRPSVRPPPAVRARPRRWRRPCRAPCACARRPWITSSPRSAI
jgi:two-component system, chemotaxis family, sensor kinase CheA